MNLRELVADWSGLKELQNNYNRLLEEHKQTIKELEYLSGLYRAELERNEELANRVIDFEAERLDYLVEELKDEKAVERILNGEIEIEDLMIYSQAFWQTEDGKITKAEHSVYCSKCGAWSEYRTAYCGSCGSKMEENYEQQADGV